MLFRSLIDRAKGSNAHALLAWVVLARRMRSRVRNFQAGTRPVHEGPWILVIVSPWLHTLVPLFIIAIGLMLSAEGARVRFVLDDFRFGPGRFRHALILRLVRSIMAVVGEHHQVDLLSQVCADRPIDRGLIDRLAKLNAIWAARGETQAAERPQLARAIADQITPAAAPIAALLDSTDAELIVTQGGIFGASGLWYQLAVQRGLRVATFDAGGPTETLLATAGIAAHLADVPRAFRTIADRAAGDDRERALIDDVGGAELARRQDGTDRFLSQIVGGNAGSDAYANGVLLSLNSSWDTAALGPHVVFQGNTDWIVETVRFLLDATDAPVIVRQHPAERLAFARTTDDYAALLREHFGDHPRLHFIAAADPVNSYALLERVAATVVHSSTIGVEAAAMGRVVITPSNAYFAGLGFVWQARDLGEYHDLLRRAVAGALSVKDDQRTAARYCYYASQCCNWVFSEFAPGAATKWMRRPLRNWQQEAPVRAMLRAIMTDTPVATLHHLARVEAASAQ